MVLSRLPSSKRSKVYCALPTHSTKPRSSCSIRKAMEQCHTVRAFVCSNYYPHNLISSEWFNTQPILPTLSRKPICIRKSHSNSTDHSFSDISARYVRHISAIEILRNWYWLLNYVSDDHTQEKQRAINYAEFTQLLHDFHEEYAMEAFKSKDPKGTGYISPLDFQDIMVNVKKHLLTSNVKDNLVAVSYCNKFGSFLFIDIYI